MKRAETQDAKKVFEWLRNPLSSAAAVPSAVALDEDTARAADNRGLLPAAGGPPSPGGATPFLDDAGKCWKQQFHSAADERCSQLHDELSDHLLARPPAPRLRTPTQRPRAALRAPQGRAAHAVLLGSSSHRHQLHDELCSHMQTPRDALVGNPRLASSHHLNRPATTRPPPPRRLRRAAQCSPWPLISPPASIR